VNILAGDIGGTNTRLAIFRFEQEQLKTLHESTLQSADHDSLASAVQCFLQQSDLPCDRACFGVAGPVINQQCQTTNLPWFIDATELSGILGMGQTWLINDLEANAWGIPALDKDDFLTLQEGDPDASGNACIISAGTGLGEAGLYWDGVRHHPFATEGGHTDFAPRNALEFALLEHLQQQHDRVSWERLISGPGLVEIYHFLHHYRDNMEPAGLKKITGHSDPAAMVSKQAMDGSCPLCHETLDLFVSLYGTEAGNLALKQMATGGVYIGGGIAPKILPKFSEGAFLGAFNAKGRMTPLMHSMPVKVILNDRAALYGPALYAAAQTP